jgi:capsular polysaccharide export protein
MGLPDHIVERFHNFVINIDTPPSMFRKKFPEVIIHIGKTKCGSSYLQNKLLHNKDALLKQGILFPDTGLYFEPDNETRTSGHNDFKAVFYKTGHEAITLQNKLLRELDKQTDNVSTLLISCENISFEGVNFPFNAFKRFWGNASIKVVICTRDEDAWNSSMYTEAVSGGHLKYTKSLDDFREEMRVTGALENEGLVAFWEEALGQENVEHISLSSEDGKRVPLWDTFCERVGIDNPSSFEDIPEEKSNITRISYEITTCFRLINLLPFESAASYLSFVQQAKRQCVALSEEDAQDKGHIMEMMINEYRTRGTKPKQNGKPQPLKKDFRGANQLEVVQNELHAVLNSKSWKITAPLRYIFKLLGGR